MPDHVQDTKTPVWKVLSHPSPYPAAHVDLVYLFSDGWHNWGKSSPLLTFLFTCWTYDPWHYWGIICDQIATQLWFLTVERILRLHVLDVNFLSLSLKKWRRKKTESSHILSVPFKDMTDLSTSSDTYLLSALTWSLVEMKKICFLIYLTGRKGNQLRNVPMLQILQHKNVPSCQMNSAVFKSYLIFILL